jgi:excisionase family DNA binding protein
VATERPEPTKRDAAEPKHTLVQEGLAKLQEAEAYLGVCRATLYKMMDGGELAYVKLGKSRRVPWRALIHIPTEAASFG